MVEAFNFNSWNVLTSSRLVSNIQYPLWIFDRFRQENSNFEFLVIYQICVAYHNLICNAFIEIMNHLQPPPAFPVPQPPSPPNHDWWTCAHSNFVVVLVVVTRKRIIKYFFNSHFFISSPGHSFDMIYLFFFWLAMSTLCSKSRSLLGRQAAPATTKNNESKCLLQTCISWMCVSVSI